MVILRPRVSVRRSRSTTPSAPGIIAGHDVRPESIKLVTYSPAEISPMICSGVCVPGSRYRLPQPMPASLQAAGGIVRRLHAQLPRCIGVEQIVLQHTIFNHDGAPRRQPFASKGDVPKPPTPLGSIIMLSSISVKAGQRWARPAFPPEKEACARSNRPRQPRRENQSATRDFRREDDGRLLRRHTPRAQPAQGAPCCFGPNRFRRFEERETPSARPPAIALHRAVHVHCQRSADTPA